MQQIPLIDAKPDMVLAADVVNEQQMLLLTKGVALNTKNIRMLKSWGIAAIVIESEALPQTNPAAIDRPKIAGDIETRLIQKFGASADGKVMTAIRRAAVAILIERSIQQEAADAG